MGVVSVQLRISESRADGSKRKWISHSHFFDFILYTAVDQIASASSGDYDPQSLVTLVTFENGESEKSVTIQILNDNVPELEEYFTIHLENPQGGKAVISSTNVMIIYIHLSLYQFIYLSVHPFIYLSVHSCSQLLKWVLLLMTTKVESFLSLALLLHLMKTTNLLVRAHNRTYKSPLF